MEFGKEPLEIKKITKILEIVLKNVSCARFACIVQFLCPIILELTGLMAFKSICFQMTAFQITSLVLLIYTNNLMDHHCFNLQLTEGKESEKSLSEGKMDLSAKDLCHSKIHFVHLSIL